MLVSASSPSVVQAKRHFVPGSHTFERQGRPDMHARASYSVQLLDQTARLVWQHQRKRFLCAPALVLLSHAPSVVHVYKWTSTRECAYMVKPC